MTNRVCANSSDEMALFFTFVFFFPLRYEIPYSQNTMSASFKLHVRIKEQQIYLVEDNKNVTPLL